MAFLHWDNKIVKSAFRKGGKDNFLKSGFLLKTLFRTSTAHLFGIKLKVEEL